MLINRQHTESGTAQTIRQHNIRDYIMVYMLVCVFYPLAALCLCSPLLIVIPVTVLLSVVWETTRRQHWSHVSSLTRQFHHGQRMWSSSPRQCSTFSIDGNDWKERVQTEWASENRKPLNPKNTFCPADGHTFTPRHDCAFLRYLRRLRHLVLMWRMTEEFSSVTGVHQDFKVIRPWPWTGKWNLTF